VDLGRRATKTDWGSIDLLLRRSTDDGNSWPVSRTIEPNRTGCSGLAVGRRGNLYCFYERKGAPAIARFN
jgi:hypothetical protein